MHKMWQIIPILPSYIESKSVPVHPPIQTLTATISSGAVRLVRDPPLYDQDGNHNSLQEWELFSKQATLQEIFHLIREIVSLLSGEDVSPLHYRLVRTILQEEEDHEEWGGWAKATLQGAEWQGTKMIDHLVQKVAEEIRILSHDLRPYLWSDSIQKKNDILELDHAFMEWCSNRYLDPGQKYAALIQERATERMSLHNRNAQNSQDGIANLFLLWICPHTPGIPARWPRGLCRALWQAHLCPAYRNITRQIPVVVGPAASAILRVNRSGTYLEKYNNKLIFCDHQGVEVGAFRLCSPPSVAAVQLNVAEQIASTNADLLGSLNAYRLLDWMIPEVHRRVLAGEVDARVLLVVGGWSGLAELVGANSKRAATELHAIVATLAHLMVQFSNGESGNLLAYRECPARGRQPGSVEIVVGTMLIASVVHDLQGAERVLIPWPPPVPLVGRPNEYGAQRAFRLKVLIELRKCARELYEQGGVLISEETWERFAEEVNLPKQLWKTLLARWLRDEEDGRAFLKEVEPKRYTIGDAHYGIRLFLEEAGKIMMAASLSGKRSVQSKKKRMERVRI